MRSSNQAMKHFLLIFVISVTPIFGFSIPGWNGGRFGNHFEGEWWQQPPCTPVDGAFNPLEHLGGNSPWFPGPNIYGISSAPPDGCSVSQAVYLSRHGSRYPDPSAYQTWVDLYNKIQAARFTATGPLAFLKNWKPVLDDPSQELSQVSPGGYDELYEFGVELRTRYPGFYKYNTPFRVWTNDYPRTVDSARLFARGYIGPNSTTLGTIYAINSTNPSAKANSLATSDSCPTFHDSSGSPYTSNFDAIYLPPILARLNTYIKGNLNLTTSDISNFPYLCGFESQITRRLSPFCAVFTPQEIKEYEYRQDLRYWYGTGLGAYHNASVMLPVIQGVVDILSSGPNTTVKGSNDVLGPLVVAFTHDNQINEMASMLGIFDRQTPLDPKKVDDRRIYITSNITPMRGTIALEKLSCTGAKEPYIRILLNDAVYPVPSCLSGPGSSCPLSQYKSQILAPKWQQSGGSFASFCKIASTTLTSAADGAVTFFTDLTFPAIRTVKP